MKVSFPFRRLRALASVLAIPLCYPEIAMARCLIAATLKWGELGSFLNVLRRPRNSRLPAPNRPAMAVW